MKQSNDGRAENSFLLYSLFYVLEWEAGTKATRAGISVHSAPTSTGELQAQ